MKNVIEIVEYKGKRAFKTLEAYGVEFVDQLPSPDLVEQVAKDLLREARRSLWAALEEDQGDDPA
jgi:hypothetical protein